MAANANAVANLKGGVGPKVLERRLITGQLEPADKENLNLVRKVRALRREGATILECARHVGITERRLQQWMRRGTYEVLDRYLQNLEGGDVPEQVEEVVRKAKQDLAQFAPDAIAYYRTCFQRNPAELQETDGEFKNDAKAMWATKEVSTGLGLTRPETAVRPIININIAHIKAEQAMVRADDAEADRAVRVIDITPNEDA